MLRHIVMFKLNDNSEENKKILVDKFMSMKGQIPALFDIEAGADRLMSERSFDVCLVCTIENMEKLEEYRVHPYHQAIAQYVKSVAKQSHCVDYII